jgi:predicted anti-sigma-YlaC factor YlaD
MSNWTKIGCWRYRAALEDRVSGNGLRPEADSQLDEHLRGCPECQQDLDDALTATSMLRHTETASVEPSNAFSMRVMAAIREDSSRRATPELLWRPLEALASRFAVAAAAVLLMLSIYMAEFAPPFRPAPTASQTEVGAIMPEPPAQPATPDEVLMSLAGEGQ